MVKGEIVGLLLSQMEEYLSGKISSSEYANKAETLIDISGAEISDTNFYKIFMQIVPDLCLYFIEEPGAEQDKEQKFKQGIHDVYLQLKQL